LASIDKSSEFRSGRHITTEKGGPGSSPA
jgi:hypothetical protein